MERELSLLVPGHWSSGGNEVTTAAEKPQLQRRISLFGITMYGVGNILGAGVYALIGEVVGITGNFSWFAFILASVVGGLTGLSYAELSTMYPQSAAEFVYIDKAFRRSWLSFLLGWAHFLFFWFLFRLL